jgi:hypothetical protein
MNVSQYAPDVNRKMPLNKVGVSNVMTNAVKG